MQERLNATDARGLLHTLLVDCLVTAEIQIQLTNSSREIKAYQLPLKYIKMSVI